MFFKCNLCFIACWSTSHDYSAQQKKYIPENEKELKNEMRKFFIYPDFSCLNVIIYCFLSPPYSKLNIWTVSPHPNNTQQITNNVYYLSSNYISEKLKTIACCVK